jgi:hypothetical protein
MKIIKDKTALKKGRVFNPKTLYFGKGYLTGFPN